MQIYINKNGKQHGPFDENRIVAMLLDGQVSPNDFGIKEGQANWQKLGVMFPQAKQEAKVVVQPIYQPMTPPTASANIPNQKTGKSKGLIFGLLGCGGLILLVTLGSVAIYFFSGNQSTRQTTVSNSNSASPVPAKPPMFNDFSSMKNKAEELATISPTLKLDSKTKMSGKIAIVEKGKYDATMEGYGYDYKKLDQNVKLSFGITAEMLAKTPDEIDTLVQIICSKGKYVAKYEGNILGYGNSCKVSIIDYKSKIAFAQKTFVNNKPEKSVSSAYDGGDYIMPKPDGINEYITSFAPETIEANVASLPIIEDKALFGSTASEILGVLTFPLKLDNDAKIKGKITVIQPDMNTIIGIDRDGNFKPPLPDSITLTKERLGLTNEQLATKTSEIDTLINVNCKSGGLITKVKGISVFSNTCTVSIIDYKALTTIAQKFFDGKKVDNERYSDPTMFDDKKDTVDFPRSEIEEYIKQFPKL